MRSAPVFVVACAAALALTSSLAIARKPSVSKPFTRLAQVPETDRARTNPLVNDPDAIPGGRKLYDRHCASCHGAAGENGRKGPALRAAELQAASDGAVFWVITQGNVRSGMPVWSKLPEPQRWQITTYLKSLGPKE
jgi:mono/diheme cytochrome c family protein